MRTLINSRKLLLFMGVLFIAAISIISSCASYKSTPIVSKPVPRQVESWGKIIDVYISSADHNQHLLIKTEKGVIEIENASFVPIGGNSVIYQYDGFWYFTFEGAPGDYRIYEFVKTK